MKRILCLILSMTFIFVTSACSSSEQASLISSEAELSLSQSYETSETESSQKPESVSESDSEEQSTESENGAAETSGSASESTSSVSASSAQSSSTQQHSESSSSASSSASPVIVVSSSSSQTAASSSSSSSSSTASSSSSSAQTGGQATYSGEIRAIWFSYIEMQSFLLGKTEAQFTSSFNTALDNAVSMGLNTIFVQVRSHSDAYYDSDIFPWSVNLTGTEGKAPGYDPLRIMVSAAHSRGMKIEAWINPYRIKGTTDTAKIASSSPAYDWLGTDKVKIVQGAGIYYNPADDEVIDLVVSGVKEIVRNYDVDGIHFDDYFYPTTDASFDSSSYSAYKNGGGSLSLADWRRDNVNRLIAKTYSAIKAIDSSCSFGISPTGNMDNNFSILYCDVYAWLRSDKYLDYICPQVYFGFDNAYSSYTAVLDQYNSMISNSNIKLLVGLAAYKVGKKDSASAGGGINEWVNNNDVLARQVEAARKKSHYEGFALYRYDSVFRPESAVSAAAAKERANLEDIL